MQKRTIEQTYQKKTAHEHILLRPDTYIGSVQLQDNTQWVFDRDSGHMVEKTIKYCPGLYKIFDEILVNAADNFVRDPKNMTQIDIEIRPEQNLISVSNNGAGVPIVIHKEHKVYVPHMIFGQLLTSSNYDDGEKKVTGGRNGFGAKLANIFSTEFIVETADTKRGLHYQQIFRDNMTKAEEPRIQQLKGKRQDFTCIKFKPDLAKFGMRVLDDDIVSLLTKRAYDMAGIIDPKVKVTLNGQPIAVKGFKEYCEMYLHAPGQEETPVIVEKSKNARWQVIASLSDGQFQQVSFVNSICTTRGGTHVEYIANQITKRVKEIIDKKNKKKILIKPQHIKHNLWVFVNTQVENPAFDSQTKETLNTKSNAFGSSIELSEAFMKGILDSGIVDLVMKVANAKEEAKMAKDLGPGRKKVRLLGVPKLDDANDAGGRKSKECTIILTEGDSAKSLALAGIEVVGRDKYGVFPLRGKFLNVREAPNKQISENPEIQNLCKILGLAPGKKYESVADLRYGRVLIMTDQDHDGSHIKGLLINFVHHMWPSLLRLNGFLDEFVTPIIKATKGERVKTFFTIPEYEQWAASVGTKGWKIKYYKGLGTSTTKEAKEYFAELEDHTIAFRYRGPEDDDAIELAFAKKKADARKEWLQTYTKDLFVDHSIKELRYKDFVNKELILFSVADCARSIPSICDGFKPGQRKIIYSSFKRKLTKEIKVAQFSGYVAEHSAYHHGEVSLQGSIVALAQNFVGSNNINYLMPNGQFGTRLMGGKDAASARYIHTELSPVTRTIFPEEDDAVLECLVDEGQRIEPHHYVPILPTVLVNGAEGIGTGWSTFIPQHDPRAIVDNIRRMMAGSELQRLAPWYKGYFGTIEPLEGGRYQVTGTYEVEPVPGGDDQVTITELPVGKWTRDYKTMLEEMAARDEILEIREQHAENRVHFELCVPGASRMSEAAFLKKFKLQTTMSTNNYVLFDDEGKIQRFGNELDIMKHWFDLRAELYNARKEHMLKKLDKECEILRNKVRFITAIITGELVVSRVKRAIILEKLRSAGYTPMSEIEKLLPRVNTAAILEVKEGTEKSEEQEPDDDDAVDLGGVSAKEYDYLLAMALWSLTDEKVEQLTKQLADKQQAYQELQGTHIYTLWGRDLDRFLAALTTHEEKEEADRLAHTAKQSGGAVGKRKPRAAKKAAGQQPKLGQAAKNPAVKRAVAPKKAAQAESVEGQQPKELSLLERVQNAMGNKGKTMMSTVKDVPQRQLNQGISDADLNWFQEHVGRRQARPDDAEGGDSSDGEPEARVRNPKPPQRVEEEQKEESDSDEPSSRMRRRRAVDDDASSPFDAAMMDDDSY